MTQVHARHGNTGSGLIAIHARRVDMGIEWVDDSLLSISYPAGSSPVGMHSTWIAPGVRVEYRSLPASDIPAREWVVVSQHVITTTSQPQARGNITSTTTDGHTTHYYSYDDSSEADSHASRLRVMGYQAGGDSWAGIVYGLLQLRMPELLTKVWLDPEGGGLGVRSEDRDALVRVAELVAEVKGDDVLLDAAVQRAVRDGRME